MVNNFFDQKLKEKWFSLWSNFEVSLSQQEELLLTLLSYYSEVNRFYHNCQHLKRMLSQFDQVKHLAINSYNIQLGIWFHDCIYDPTKTDNEEKSADFAVTKLTILGLNQALINQVKDLILLTKNHQICANLDGKILLDLDLAILGSCVHEYKIYMMAIRQEYAWLNSQIYAQKRREILERFLAKERIYQTNFFHEKLERQAKINLKQELKCYD